MLSFVIGKVEGPWENFRPPIQGGVFHRRDISAVDSTSGTPESTELEDNLLESPPRSISPSSVSSLDDDSIIHDSEIRQRKKASSIASSMTSVEDGSPVFDPEVITRAKIAQDLIKYPAVDDATQRTIVFKYRELQKRIDAEGLYNCNYWAYGRECIRYSLLFTGCMLGLYFGWYKTAAFCLGAFWHQLVFSAHDAGHIGITHNYQVDSVIGIIIADFLGGLSIGWWKRNHNVRFSRIIMRLNANFHTGTSHRHERP